jgi:hypothetical protein
MIKNYIAQEESKIVNMISDRISLPNISAAKERELIKKLYDTLEEVVNEVLKAI